MARYDFPWHDDSCVKEFRYEDHIKVPSVRKHYWCATHGQWCSVIPEAVIVVLNWADGTSSSLEMTADGEITRHQPGDS